MVRPLVNIVYVEELDRALAHRKIALGRPNIRLGRCAVWTCRLPVLSGKGRHLYLDGVHRGIVCCNHEWYVLDTAQKGKAEIDV